jgi:hypothetical protein
MKNGLACTRRIDLNYVLLMRSAAELELEALVDEIDQGVDHSIRLPAGVVCEHVLQIQKQVCRKPLRNITDGFMELHFGI